jgi:hypothetical protein
MLSLLVIALLAAACTRGNAQTPEPDYALLPEVQTGSIITDQAICLNTQLSIDTYRPCSEFSSNGQGGILHDSSGWVTLGDVNGPEMLSYEREPPALRWCFNRSNPVGFFPVFCS